jgi:hypothetical protein
MRLPKANACSEGDIQRGVTSTTVAKNIEKKEEIDLSFVQRL